MNIESARIVSVAAAAVEAGAHALPASSTMPEGFTEALTEQIKLASEARELDAVPKPLQQLTSGENLNRLQSIAGLLGGQGAAQELAALFGKNLPMSYKISGEDDLEDTLSTLTEALKQVSAGAAAVQDNQANPGQVDVLAIVEPDNAQTDMEPITGDLGIPASEVQTANPLVSTEAVEVIRAMLAAAAFPGQEGEKITEAAPSGNQASLKIPLPAANHPAETVQQTGAEVIESADDVRPKDNVFRQIIRDGQEMLGLKKAGLAEKMEQAGQVAVMETEEILPRVATDSLQPSKQMADSRVEVPTIARPVGHPEWNRDLGERIIWMHNKAMPTAEIKLNPQHLGPISVRIDMNQDQATVTFTAQHAAVREALEASVPRLREMMNAQQINLADVNVFQNSTEQKQSQSQAYPRPADDWEQGAGRRGDQVIADDEEEAGKIGAVVSKGLLSIYA